MSCFPKKGISRSFSFNRILAICLAPSHKISRSHAMSKSKRSHSIFHRLSPYIAGLPMHLKSFIIVLAQEMIDSSRFWWHPSLGVASSERYASVAKATKNDYSLQSAHATLSNDILMQMVFVRRKCILHVRHYPLIGYTGKYLG